MSTRPKNLLAELDDIKGLDHISLWPLAPGWWILLAAVFFASCVAAILYWRRQVYWRSWKGDAWMAFDMLAARLANDNTQQTAAALSLLLRRVAVHGSPRAECAGLQGLDWLRWLTQKDPAKFDWSQHGGLLIEAPYMPPSQNFSPETLRILIIAGKRWVK